MLNRVILMGRITQDLEVRQTPSGNAVLRFNVAVDRPVRQGAERQTDFISCVAWGQRAEFINRYFAKGRMIALEGQLRTGSYDDKNGVKHYTTDVNVDSVSFTGEPKAQGGNYSNNYSNGGYQNNGYQQPQGGGYSQPQQSYNNNANQNNYNNAPANDALSIGDLADFEEVLSDDGVPF
ncbi:single-stranded DNA-binding protein [Ruminococcus sp.]|uniref:single-stranded DNA-binding protein n=1 Tax=Ruminococcus sp. TaxID=41978 RepID=UPI0025EC50CB|nr:single-stranded DNA-binding protein [Ruminococcus sp.]